MKVPRHDFGICIFQNQIVVAGGGSGTGFIPTVEAANLDFRINNKRGSDFNGYTSQVSRWELLAELNEPAYNPCLVNFNDRWIFKINGMKALNSLSPTLEIYDSEICAWNVMITIEQYIAIGPQAIQINESDILIVGGKLQNDQASTNLFRMSVTESGGAHNDVKVNVAELEHKFQTNGEINEIPVCHNNSLYFVESV